MLKKKILSLVLALSMVSGLGIVTAQAETTDAISSVLLDSSNFTWFGEGQNRIAAFYNNAKHENDIKDYLVVKSNETTVSAATERRIVLNQHTYAADGKVSTRTAYNIAASTTPVYLSFDVYGNDINNVSVRISGTSMQTTAITSSQLKADGWNTISVVYYPNSSDNSKCGYADTYLNGTYQGTKDMSSVASSTTQTRIYFWHTSVEAATNGVKFDNFKIYEMTSFTRAAVDTTDLAMIDGKISEYVTVTRDASYVPTDYATMTVAELEEATGATVYAADGSEAADSAPVSSDMTLASANTVDGLGTFTASVGISNVAYVLADSTECVNWANGWNRYVAGASKQTRVTADAVAKLDGEVCVDYKANSLTEPTRFAVSQCYWVDTATKPGFSMYPGRAGVPMYWSVDVYGNGALTDIKMGFDGNKYINTTGIPASALKENEWNTISAVHYPNLEDDTYLGSADVYLNGELWVAGVDLSNCTSASYKQVILYGTGTSLDSVIYYDNSKCYLMSDVARPFPAGTKVVDGKITNYVAQTVAEFEAATGATVKMADGTDAADDAQIAEGMKVTVTNEVEGIGTLSGTLELGAASVYTLGDWNVTVDGEKVYNNVYTKSGELKATLAVGGSVDFTTILIERAASGAKVKAVAAKQSFTAGGEATVTCDITDGNSYELLVWTSANSMEPLMDKVTVTKAE